jgi:hypothetical protein
MAVTKTAFVDSYAGHWCRVRLAGINSLVIKPSRWDNSMAVRQFDWQTKRAFFKTTALTF